MVTIVKGSKGGTCNCSRMSPIIRGIYEGSTPCARGFPSEELLNEPGTVFWDFDNPKNFAADGPTPGQWLFSDGQSGSVGREADDVPAEVKAANTFWGIKYNPDRGALELVTPETATLYVIAPGAGAGGVGVEGDPPALHFVTFAGLLTASPADTMNPLQTTLDLRHPVTVRLHTLQAR